MAKLLSVGDRIELHLSFWERLGAMHSSMSLPKSSVTSLRAVEDAGAERRGLRAPGTGIPGRISLGTYRGSFGKDFVAAYGHDPGVVVELEGQEFQRLVVSCDDASDVVSALGPATA